ncbi:Ca-activated chloride channel family protein [Prauserella marina]|uniref:Ca-activated chloride channel family protein n=1 Tax=Prauserella marina TaxID=530584 RepID=A0A1G6NJ88_9PSEU|nr:VWA domain-containing protein [Prauserella marina]PWV82383.1 Ca-activated chloride channel family protein [Prauserella marina]SDC67829.1 Ca-activated chloride channel family protein [Prauserella marina]
MSRPARPAKLLTAALAAATFLALPATAAQAQEAEPKEQYAPTMLVLDASGSMAGEDPSGGTKMDAAKRAVHGVVEAAPTGSQVGLAAYGTGTGNSAAEKARGCQDVTVVHEPQPIKKDALTKAVDGLSPSGYTPIGKALQVAAEQLPEDGPRSIVLVSDGEDTCAPPEPCEVVKQLDGRGVELVVHTVGFGVDDAARKQLTCVAQSTGGTYTDAPDAKTLEQTLPRVTATALRNYEPAGTPITGTETYDPAPAAKPGQHLDTIGQKEKRYYAVDVPQGATAYFSATVSFPRLSGVSMTDDINSLQLRTYGENGQDCHEFASEMATRSSDGIPLTVATTWKGAIEEKTGETNRDRCQGGGRYYFALEWATVSSGVPERLPVELLVGVEPAATETGPVAVKPKVEFSEPSGADIPVVGGGSFNVAGVIDGSHTYADTVQRGEFVFYKVKLDWGQGLAYRVRFDETPKDGTRTVSNISTTFYSPYREEIDWDTTVYTGEAKTLPANDPAISTVPVRYNNRDADVRDARSQSVAGWYYIAVKVSPPHTDDGTAPSVPIKLDLTVTDEIEQGPSYQFASDEDRKNGPFGGQRAPGTPADDGDARSEANQVNTAASTSMVSTTGWIVIASAGVLVLVALLVGGLAVRRRKTTQ